MTEPATMYTTKNDITWITLNRPKSLNALNDILTNELLLQLDNAAVDHSRSVVLTGAGRAFCAGGDLDYLRSLNDIVAAKEFITKVGDLVKRIRSLPKPVIAMVNGVAAGAGFNLALACDIVYAAKSARFAQSFAKVGLIPDCAGMYLLPRLAGLHKAKELMFTGGLITAEEAKRCGLLNHICEDEMLQETVLQFANQLKTSAPLALAAMKRTLNAADTLSLDQLLAEESAMQALCMQTSDHKEGIAAFKEKRTPRFSGC